MFNGRIPLSRVSKARVPGRQPQGHGRARVCNAQNFGLEDEEDPALRPYVREPWDRSYKGPTRAQRTERQYSPMSDCPLSPNSAWRIWEASQNKKERAHNARMVQLLAEKESNGAQEVDEEEEEEGDSDELEMGDEPEEGYQYEVIPPRYSRGQQERRGHPEDFGEDIYGASPERTYAPRAGRRKRSLSDYQEEEDVPSGNSSQASKRRKYADERIEPSKAGHSPRLSRRREIPARRQPESSHPVQPAHPHQSNRSPCYPSSSARPRYSYPGLTLSRSPQPRSQARISFSPPPFRPRSAPRDTPERQPDPARVPFSPTLFVRHLPRSAEGWPFAEDNDEMEDDVNDELGRSTTPLEGPSPQHAQQWSEPSEKTDESPTADPMDLQCLDFKKGILAPIELMLGAPLEQIDVTSQAKSDEDGKKIRMGKMFNLIELATKKPLQASLDRLALVQKAGFLNLKKSYREAIEKTESYEEQIECKDREIDRLREVLKEERRRRG